MIDTPLTRDLGIEVPLICGAMYPCTNPELVAAVSAAGGIGIVQPLSMVHVYGHEFRAGLQLIKTATDKPWGMNALIEATTRSYEERMRRYVEVAIEEGVTVIVTSLGKPDWVVNLAKPAGVKVYHDVTERKWAQKAIDCGVDGLICVNSEAGGHLGDRTPQQLVDELADLGLPLVCAGGIGTETDFVNALQGGYAGVQMGTRFIATTECGSHADYKQAVVDAAADDIVATDKISGVPCTVINTPYVEKIGVKAGRFARWMLRGRKTKKWMRAYYGLKAFRQLKRSSQQGQGYLDYWVAGRSAGGVTAIEPAGDIVRRFAAAASAALAARS